MHKMLRALTIAVAVGAASAAQAGTVNFDNPDVITIDNNSIATYLESGYSITGDAAAFLPIDSIGTAMSGGLVLFANNTITLAADMARPFSFTGFDAGRYDPSSSAMLTLTGLFANNTQKAVTLSLGSLSTYAFNDFAGASGVRFMATSDVVLDTLAVQTSPVPEPATNAMMLAGLGVLVALRKRAQRN